jgi:hypothetical protein
MPASRQSYSSTISGSQPSFCFSTLPLSASECFPCSRIMVEIWLMLPIPNKIREGFRQSPR